MTLRNSASANSQFKHSPDRTQLEHAHDHRHNSTESSSAASWRSTHSSDTVRRLHADSPMSASPEDGVDERKATMCKNNNIDAVNASTMTQQLSKTARAEILPWELDDSWTSTIPKSSRSDSNFASAPTARNNSISDGVYAPDSDDPEQASSSSFGTNLPANGDGSMERISSGYLASNSAHSLVDRDDRRPSIASATTVSSTGSKQSVTGRFHKKLQGFFGEEFSEETGGRQNSETSTTQSISIPQSATGPAKRHRHNSMNDANLRNASDPPSPSASRPRTPAPSSEVTPWVFQEPPPEDGATDSFFPDPDKARHTKTSGGSRLHLPGHRHNRSYDEKSNVLGYPLRASTSREHSFSGPRLPGAPSSTHLKQRATSPAPSSHSSHGSAFQHHRSPGGHGGNKRSLFDRVTGRHKGDKPTAEALGSSTSTISLTSTSFPSATPRTRVESSAPRPVKPKKPASLPQNATLPTKKESRLPFKTKKTADGTLNDQRPVRDPNAQDSGDASALWHLDTDITQMEGIVDLKMPPMTPPTNEIYVGWPGEPVVPKEAPVEESGAWDAPDSWAVKRVADENVERLRELDDEGNVSKDDDPGPMYFMRIFRADSTFAVISAGLNTTAAELISMMAKKTFLQEELNNYQIVMRKHDTSRQLEPGERPLVLQKRLLEMAGYTERDKLEDLGREDHGYLCRFTFLPTKMGGYSSLERDPGFNKMQRFNHIDLTGRNLVTIPITLYQRAAELITLNLSRNLTLDIPKDFIQSCTQLREIKFTGNEAWRLPHSLSLAARLTMLDVSNNRLEQLDSNDLWRLTGLVSLKLSNNLLTSVPAYFAQYHALRSLNLSSNSLTAFPVALRQLTTLVDLDISFNGLSTLGDIGTLVNLERLWATNNKLSGPFDQSFEALINLREIDARFNAITNMDVVSQLPKLEMLMLGHNSISQFEGSFHRLKVLFLNHNPVTNFDLVKPIPSLSVLNLASAKLSQLPETLFAKMIGLTKLTISKNHFVSLSPNFGLLSKLEYLSIAKNELNKLPAEVGRLTELRYLDVRENNLGQLPPEIWYARKLETLNVSSNVLQDFPKLGASLPPLIEGEDGQTQPTTSNSSPDFDELGKLEDFQIRRPSQASGMLSVSGSPGTPSRKASIVSYSSSRPSGITRSSTTTTLSTIGPIARKDSTLSGRLATTFSTTLRHLFLADNRLEDDVFNELVMLPELRILNLSYNQLYDIPPRTIRRWTYLTELYLSGNDLTSLPSEDLEEGSNLKVLHLNSNKFQVLPAELGNLQKLAILDVGCNQLKYNVSNWPYDWNWNCNHQLRYLNLSGNKRLEIKPTGQAVPGREQRDLTDFSALTNLRILGLMDVTLMIPSVPDQGADRRVRTAGSAIGNTMPYGMADSLGRNEHLSTLDILVPRFRGHEDETLVGMFDGQSLSSGGSRVAKYLHDKFKHFFIEELDKLKQNENAGDALRRTYLGLNKELATAASSAIDARHHPSSALIHRGSIVGPELSEDDITSGSVSTVMYLHGMELYVSNVGDAQAVLIQSEGGHRSLTAKHDPAEMSERARIREAGGYVSRQGKLNDQLDVSRAFGYVELMPCEIAAPHICKVDLKESDEIILLASRELWDYLTPEFAVDVARSERNDLMRAAQKLRDLAIAFGATGKIMVMMIGVSDLRKRERAKFRTHSMSMGPTGSPDDYFIVRNKGKRGRDAVGDSKLARLDQEVEAPVGDVALVFTDIKNSTILWETYPVAMQSAIKMHNEVMRRHLRIIGGYEVKTEGDAFMVAFPTVTSALLWCFTVQSQLLDVQWPQEILNSVHGQEVFDGDGNAVFRGLSVRMGIHYGRPVCEVDPVTKRMDYFGPMVNRAARIEGVADGGQICVSTDFIQEVQRMLESHIESDRAGSTGSEDTLNDDLMNQTIRRELRSLSSQGFEVKDLGQRTLKGLENPEYIYLMYPHSLAGRLVVQQQRADAETSKLTSSNDNGDASRQHNAEFSVDTENVWDLWSVSLRLEMLCSSLESTGNKQLKPPETAMLERIKHGAAGEVTDRFLINFVEHQISRIETCISTLAVRNMIRPFKNGMLTQACPMADILGELTMQLEELKTLKTS